MVEWVMRHALAGDSVAPWEDLRTLAAEVQRLEGRLAHSHEAWKNAHDQATRAEARATQLDAELIEAGALVGRWSGKCAGLEARLRELERKAAP